MEQELAKQLEDAGFPQREGDWYTSDGQWIPEEERRYYPTLSELMEACKEEGRSIELSECQEWWDKEWDKDTNYYKLDKNGKPIPKLMREYHWEVTLSDWESKEYGKHPCYESGDEVVEKADGITPKIAMAKLWLKRNKKLKNYSNNQKINE